jgi:hypothetical protein
LVPKENSWKEAGSRTRSFGESDEREQVRNECAGYWIALMAMGTRAVFNSDLERIHSGERSHRDIGWAVFASWCWADYAVGGGDSAS